MGLTGKNAQKNQSSAEQIDHHPLGIFQMAYGKAFKLQMTTTDQKPRREKVN